MGGGRLGTAGQLPITSNSKRCTVGKTMLSTSHDWEWFLAPIKMVMTGGWFIMVSTILAKIKIKIDDRFFIRFITAPGGNHLLFLSVHHCLMNRFKHALAYRLRDVKRVRVNLQIQPWSLNPNIISGVFTLCFPHVFNQN